MKQVKKRLNNIDTILNQKKQKIINFENEIKKTKDEMKELCENSSYDVLNDLEKNENLNKLEEFVKENLNGKEKEEKEEIIRRLKDNSCQFEDFSELLLLLNREKFKNFLKIKTKRLKTGIWGLFRR